MQCIDLAVFYFSIGIAGYRRQCKDGVKLNEQEGDLGQLLVPADVNFMLLGSHPGVFGLSCIDSSGKSQMVYPISWTKNAILLDDKAWDHKLVSLS